MGRAIYKALIAACCLFAACVKDKPGGNTSALPGSSGNVYVVCEGNFGYGDGSLYAFNPAENNVYGDLYRSANGQPLGDVFQSMQRIGDKLFLCVNSSDKVVVVNAANWTSAATINIPKPRYILPVSPVKAYVSTLYSNKVYIIDPNSAAVTGTIDLPHVNSEGLCRYNDAAFICPWDTACNFLYKVDINTDQVIQQIQLPGYAPQAALLDKNQMLWVISGNRQKGRQAAISYIDPSTGTVVKSFMFPAEADVLKPAFNRTRDTLYFIEVNYNGGTTNNGIYRMAITDAALPSQPFVQARQYQYFWALGIDPATNEIYIGDPKGFIQKGTVSVLGPDGSERRTFNVGVGPGQFYFDK